MNEATYTQMTLKRVVELTNVIYETNKASNWSKVQAISRLNSRDDGEIAKLYDEYQATADVVGLIKKLKVTVNNA